MITRSVLVAAAAIAGVAVLCAGCERPGRASLTGYSTTADPHRIVGVGLMGGCDRITSARARESDEDEMLEVTIDVWQDGEPCKGSHGVGAVVEVPFTLQSPLGARKVITSEGPLERRPTPSP